MKAAVLAFWQARKPGEQRTLLIGGAALAVLLVFTFAILPLFSLHAALADSLPGLRRDALVLEQQADEAQRLRQSAGGQAFASTPLPASAVAIRVETLARSAGLRTLMDAWSVQPDGRIQFTMQRISFDAFVDWSQRLRRELGVSVESLEAQALDDPGLVRLKAVLAPAGAGAGGQH